MANGPKVSVVIPYFQRQKGLLETCVRSILAQRGIENWRVIVVDDGSPLSAAEELADILESTSRVSVIRQANAGPGAARNKGLGSVEPDTDYVAFLDSDDQWTENFLADALLAFANGCDLFFGNSRRYEVEKTRFDWSSDADRNLDPASHTEIDSAHQLYMFKGDFFDFAIVRSSIISTSTLVYRYAKAPRLRFNEKLFNGQDRLFKLMLSKQAAKVAFCMRVCAVEGRGVNIFDSSAWGSEKSLNLLLNYIKLSKVILKEIDLDKKQSAHVRAQLAESRASFAGTILHLVKNGVKVDLSVVLKTVAADPMTGVLVFPHMARVVMKKLGART